MQEYTQYKLRITIKKLLLGTYVYHGESKYEKNETQCFHREIAAVNAF